MDEAVGVTPPPSSFRKVNPAMRPRRGFTLTELLVVLVIIGLLAIMALPRLRSTQDEALVATMKSDLRNLVTAQDAYLIEHNFYYSGGIPNAAFAFSPSTGVSITLPSVVGGGWQAEATHASSPRTCALFMGTASPIAPATIEGSPACN
jgi:type IV pilus assembly protein PilA